MTGSLGLEVYRATIDDRPVLENLIGKPVICRIRSFSWESKMTDEGSMTLREALTILIEAHTRDSPDIIWCARCRRRFMVLFALTVVTSSLSAGVKSGTTESAAPGTVVAQSDDGVLVTTADGAVLLTHLEDEAGTRLAYDGFSVGERFS